MDEAVALGSTELPNVAAKVGSSIDDCRPQTAIPTQSHRSVNDLGSLIV